MIESPALVTGPDPSEAAAVVILMHGRGGSPEDMRRLAEALDLPSVRFVMPGAPGGTWYPDRFMAPIERNEPFLSQALARYEAIVTELIAVGVHPQAIVPGGFSQGACLTAEFLIRHPRRYGAALILTGGLIGPPGTHWQPQPALAGVPVYLTGSKVDVWVPVARTLETERVLRESGAAVTARVFDDGPHGVAREEVATARGILIAVAAGINAPTQTVSDQTSEVAASINAE